MELADNVRRLLEEYVPEKERGKWPDKNYEIHYYDIIFGKNVFSHLYNVQKKELSDKIFEMIASAKPRMFATTINKTDEKDIQEQNISPKITGNAIDHSQICQHNLRFVPEPDHFSQPK